MTLQNRVLPTGEIISDPARGTLTGNRGILHRPDRTLGPSRWKHRNWIACALSFKGRHRTPMSPGTWTELFFLDEATAFAAGHRPCAECRRGDYNRFMAAWTTAFGSRPKARELDRMLHAARVRRDRTQIRHEALAGTLPDGAFVLWNGAPHLVAGDEFRPYSTIGYGDASPLPASMVTVLTPAPFIEVFRAGYIPAIHPTGRPPGQGSAV